MSTRRGRGTVSDPFVRQELCVAVGDDTTRKPAWEAESRRASLDASRVGDLTGSGQPSGLARFWIAVRSAVIMYVHNRRYTSRPPQGSRETRACVRAIPRLADRSSGCVK